MSRKGFAYMVRCSDGSYYVGSTADLEYRLVQHNDGTGASYTRTRRPVTLVWVEEHDRIDEAFAREKQVQGWGRAKREALIRQQHEDLPGLSVSYKSRRRRAADGDG